MHYQPRMNSIGKDFREQLLASQYEKNKMAAEELKRLSLFDDRDDLSIYLKVPKKPKSRAEIRKEFWSDSNDILLEDTFAGCARVDSLKFSPEDHLILEYPEYPGDVTDMFTMTIDGHLLAGNEGELGWIAPNIKYDPEQLKTDGRLFCALKTPITLYWDQNILNQDGEAKWSLLPSCVRLLKLHEVHLKINWDAPPKKHSTIGMRQF